MGPHTSLPGPASAAFPEQVCDLRCATALPTPALCSARQARTGVCAGDAAAAGHDRRLCSLEPQRKLVAGAEQVTNGHDVSLSFKQAQACFKWDIWKGSLWNAPELAEEMGQGKESSRFSCIWKILQQMGFQNNFRKEGESKPEQRRHLHASPRPPRAGTPFTVTVATNPGALLSD